MELGQILALALNIFAVSAYVIYGVKVYHKQATTLLTSMSIKVNQVVKLFVHY